MCLVTALEHFNIFFLPGLFSSFQLILPLQCPYYPIMASHVTNVGEGKIIFSLPSLVLSWELCSKSQINKRNVNRSLFIGMPHVYTGDNQEN